MKKLIIAAVVGIMAIGATAIDKPAHADERIFGTLLGAAGGGLIGSRIGSGRGQLAATAFGTLVGAMVGHRIAQTHTRPAATTVTVTPEPAYTYHTTTYYREPAPRRPHFAPRQLTWPRHSYGSYGTTTTTVRTVRRSIDPWGRECRRVTRHVETAYGSRRVTVRECN